MLIGRLLNERYKIKSMIGGGGMANVYLADDTILNREVAIKVLRLEYANDHEFITRFDREAQAASSLSHPNIVNIYDVGEEEHILYMVMEYVDGYTLKEYIQKFGPLSIEESVHIMQQITHAIAHAHAYDLVHRDIKPQNILIDHNGQVKVTDFGIAVALSATALTKTNSVLGSVHYLSPEQARGGLATKKSDIYSLGIVFYELLTGQLPFSGESPVSIALKHLQNDIPFVRTFNPNIPQSIENIVLQATAKDPFYRYETVYDMNVALSTALEPENLHSERFTIPEEDGEVTKAIPIITNEQMNESYNDDQTIVYHEQDATQTYDRPEEQPKKKPKKKKRRKRLIITLISLFGLLAATLIALFIFPGILQPKDVVIPDVVGEPFDDAKEELEQLNLHVEQEMMFSEDVDIDHVVHISPKEGRTVKEKSTVTLFVSEGPPTVTFGNYVGEDFQQVKRLLENEGFEVTHYDKTSDEPVGQILTQVQPEPDSEVVPAETRVIFEVSSGPETNAVGNLIGLNEQEARDFLEANELKVNVIEEHSDTVEKGYVIRQEPAAQTELEKGATVTVYISKGPKQLPPAQHTVSFTVPYTGEDGEKQTVLIYINDMENDLANVYLSEEIDHDKEYTITLMNAPNKTGEYKVMRDDDMLIKRSIPYKEGG